MALHQKPRLPTVKFGLGKRQEAQHHLTTATTMYREMEMRFWLGQAITATRQLGWTKRAESTHVAEQPIACVFLAG